MTDNEYTSFVLAATEANEDAMFADNFNDAIIGLCHRAGGNTVIAYDIDKVIEILVVEHDMSIEEAVEYAEFNVFSAYVGENTPVFIEKMENIIERF
jgi:hypothetical protein